MTDYCMQEALLEWRQHLGDAGVLDGQAAQLHYGADTSGAQRRIAAALCPQHADQIPELMRIATRHGAPIHPISTGRNWGYGSALPPSQDMVILDLSALKRILHIDARLGVVTLEPGVTQGMLADFLTQQGLPYMVPTTGAGPSCSILANALERGYGITPHTDHFAAVTDLEAVLPDGSLYRGAMREAGGEELGRLFRWGIGPYMHGLFTQSGMGVVTRMSLALARRPESIKVCFFSLRHDDLLPQAIERIQRLLGDLHGTIGGLNLMNQHRVLAMTAPYPAASELDSDGLIPDALLQRMGRAYQILPWTGFASLYGTQRVVKAAQRDMRQALSGIASRMVFLSQTQASWLSTLAARLPGSMGHKLSRTASTLASALELVSGTPNETALPLAYWRQARIQRSEPGHPAKDGSGLSWYAPLVPMKPDAVLSYLNFLKQTTRRHGMEPLITLTSLGDRLFDSTVPLLFERDDPAAAARARQCLSELINQGRALGFHPYRLGIDSMVDYVGQHPCSAQLQSRIKAAVDPGNIMSTGRYE